MDLPKLTGKLEDYFTEGDNLLESRSLASSGYLPDCLLILPFCDMISIMRGPAIRKDLAKSKKKMKSQDLESLAVAEGCIQGGLMHLLLKAAYESSSAVPNIIETLNQIDVVDFFKKKRNELKMKKPTGPFELLNEYDPLLGNVIVGKLYIEYCPTTFDLKPYEMIRETGLEGQKLVFRLIRKRQFEMNVWMN